MKTFDRMFGDVRVTRVEEDVRMVARPEDWYIDYDAEALTPHLPWMAPHFYAPDEGRLISSLHSWVLRTGSLTILVDTCAGNHKDRPGFPGFHMLDNPYLARLQAVGVAPEDVDLVLCTHLHVDHVGWNTRLDNGRWVPTFPNARYLMSRADHAHFEAAAHPGRSDTKPMTRNTYNDSVLPVVEAGLSCFMEGDETLAPGLSLCPAPGHTPGQVRLDLSSRGALACFCGDVLHHPLQVPLWHWRTRVCVDAEQACTTRREVLQHCVDSGAMLLPAHFAHPHGAFIHESNGTFGVEWPEPASRGKRLANPS